MTIVIFSLQEIVLNNMEKISEMHMLEMNIPVIFLQMNFANLRLDFLASAKLRQLAVFTFIYSACKLPILQTLSFTPESAGLHTCTS